MTCTASSSEDPLQSEVSKLKWMVKKLKLELHRTKKEKKALLNRKLKQEATIKKLFGHDQLLALSRGGMRGVRWTASTVKKALRLRFSCGASGYNLLLQQGYPLPSVRTLQRRMESLTFMPGILSQVFYYLGLKVSELKEEERICCLTLDEMAITSNIEYDASTSQVLGNITLPDHTGYATHGLVFMLAGVSSRWKQTVAFYFTGNSTDGTVLKPIVLDLIKRAAEISLHVIAVTSDMGSANRAMWRSFNILTAKHCKTVNKIPHPQNPQKWLYFLADVPHVIKNLKAALVNGQIFTLPDNVVSANNINCSTVSLAPIQDLAKFQEPLDLKIAPKLTQSTLAPSHFEKMKVSGALNFFSNAVSSGLRYLVKEENRSSGYLATAWFLDTCNHWFDLMSSRHPVLALSKLRPEKYKEAVMFLHSVIDLFKNLKIGERGYWKPVQTGIIMSTTSVLEIQDELLNAGYKFLLTSRLTQDCLENLFSMVKLKNPIPSPLAFKYALKIISVSQFMKPLATQGSYQEDDREFAIDFLDQPVPLPKREPEMREVQLSQAKAIGDLNVAELNSLYYLVGYCVYAIKKIERVCPKCICEIESSTPGSHYVTALTDLKE